MGMYDNMVVARVRIRMPRKSMVDKTITDEVRAKHGIADGWGSMSKKLYDMPEVTGAASAQRKLFREKGVPWSSSGEEDGRKADASWAFVGKDVKEVLDETKENRERFEKGAMAARDNYDELVLGPARQHLKGGFRAEDFPTAEEFYEMFGWEVEIVPLMDVADVEKDFRLKLPAKIAEQQVAVHAEAQAKKVRNVLADLVGRAHREILGDGKGDKSKDKGLLNGVESYNPDEGDKRKGNSFRDVRLYGNMGQIRDFAHSVNTVFQSDEIGEFCQNMDTFCDKVLPKDPADIRTDDKVRAQVVDAMKAMLNGIPVSNVMGEDDSHEGKDASAPKKKKAPKKKAAKKTPKKATTGGFGNNL